MTYYPTPDELRLLSKTALFQSLSKTQLKSILQVSHRHYVIRESFLFHQGEPASSFYLLLQGHVRLTQITPRGRQIIVHFLGPGDAMALVAILLGECYPVSAEATTDSKILSWDRATTFQLLEQYPPLAVNSLQMVARRFWDLQNRYRVLATEPVERRIAHVIVRLVEQNNGYKDGYSAQVLSLSGRDLAEMAGTTHYTVSRICSSWEQQEILSTGRGKFTVLDVEALIAIADDLP